MKVIEQSTGTVWNAQKTYNGTGNREFWVMYASGPISKAKPGFVGFYSREKDIETQLGNK